MCQIGFDPADFCTNITLRQAYYFCDLFVAFLFQIK